MYVAESNCLVLRLCFIVLNATDLLEHSGCFYSHCDQNQSEICYQAKDQQELNPSEDRAANRFLDDHMKRGVLCAGSCGTSLSTRLRDIAALCLCSNSLTNGLKLFAIQACLARTVDTNITCSKFLQRLVIRGFAGGIGGKTAGLISLDNNRWHVGSKQGRIECVLCRRAI